MVFDWNIGGSYPSPILFFVLLGPWTRINIKFSSSMAEKKVHILITKPPCIFGSQHVKERKVYECTHRYIRVLNPYRVPKIMIRASHFSTQNSLFRIPVKKTNSIQLISLISTLTKLSNFNRHKTSKNVWSNKNEVYMCPWYITYYRLTKPCKSWLLNKDDKGKE